MWYVPGGRFVREKMPSPLVLTAYLTFVRSFTSCTSAACTTAPVASRTCPFTVAVGDCAARGRTALQGKIDKIRAMANRGRIDDLRISFDRTLPHIRPRALIFV